MDAKYDYGYDICTATWVKKYLIPCPDVSYSLQQSSVYP